MYIPAHEYFLRFAESTAVISDTTGLISDAPSISGEDTFDVGYTSPNDVSINDNAGPGFASGAETSLYDKIGFREISLNADLRIGSGQFVADYCLVDGLPPELDFFYGASGKFARAIYKARCAGCGLAFDSEGNKEVTATAKFEGQAYEAVSAITLGYDFEEFGPALLWTDVRAFAIGAQSLIGNVMGLTVDVDRQPERKNGRNEFGANVPGSRTAFDILTHHKVVSGTLQLHDLPSLESALFYANGTAMKWSDITLTINDVATSKIFDVTIVKPRPNIRQQQAIGSEGQMNWSVPFVASNITVATSREE